MTRDEILRSLADGTLKAVYRGTKDLQRAWEAMKKESDYIGEVERSRNGLYQDVLTVDVLTLRATKGLEDAGFTLVIRRAK